MSDRKKVLIVNDTIQYGGTDIVAIRLQQGLDDEKFDCTYCVRKSAPGPMESVVARTGVRIIHQPDEALGYVKSFFFYRDLFRRERFDIVHCHLPFFGGIVLLAARLAGVKRRIVHSHFSAPIELTSSELKKKIMHIYQAIMRRVISLFATDIIGCTEAAGEFLAGRRGFKKKGIVLNNGIDVAEYAYDEPKRLQKRQELGIDGKTVIGHIGQMYYVKNHRYLIDVFCEYQKRHEDSVLMLVSDGPDRAVLEARVEELGLRDKVMFLGFRDDIPELLLAMDCFVFPSIHEGFPLTLIEAQASGLPCIISDNVTRAAGLNDNIAYMSIEAQPEAWAEKIDELIGADRGSVDISGLRDGFDIKSISRRLEEIYLS